MSHCKDCRDSLLNGQKSLIPDPECHDNCPAESDCEGIQTYTDCVNSNKAFECLGTDVNATQTEINQAVNDALCDLENSCNTWTELTKGNLGLSTGWAWVGGDFEKPAISDVKGCIVRLAGTISRSILNPVIGNSIQIGVLPVGKRPNKIRRYSVNVTTSLTGFRFASFITVYPSGLYYYDNVEANPHTATISLDGISIEIGTII